MPAYPPPREEEDCPPGSSGTGSPGRAPVVVTEGLTYRDLQRAIFLAFGLLLIYQMLGPLTTLLLLFLLVFILAAVLNPLVTRLQAHRIPRTLSAAVLTLLILGVLVGVVWLAVPPLLDEIGGLARKLSQPGQVTQYYNDVVARAPFLKEQLPPPESLLQNAGQFATRMVTRVGQYGLNVVAGIFSLLILMVLVIYSAAQPQPLLAGLLGATPARYRPRMETALRRILEQLKNWAVGSALLGLIVGVMTGIGLFAISRIMDQPFPYILLFSVIAAIGEMIPNIGPIGSAIPPVLIALSIDVRLGIAVLILFVVIQQLENNFIVPLVMGQSLNLHPVSIIATVLIMGNLFGLLGAVLAVPVCAILKVCWEEFYLAPHNTDTGELEGVADDIVAHSTSTRGHPAHDGAVEQIGEISEAEAEESKEVQREQHS